MAFAINVGEREGVSRIIIQRFFFFFKKKSLLQNHLESLPDCQNGFFVFFTFIIFIIQKQHSQNKYNLQGWGRHLPSVLFIRQEDVRRCWSSLKSCIIVSFILRIFCWWWASPISFNTSLTLHPLQRCWAPEVRGACSSCCQEERSSQVQWCCQEIKNRMRDSVAMILNNAIVTFQQRWKANSLFCLVWK